MQFPRTKEEVDLEYQQYREFSSNLANGLVKGSEVLGRGMVRGAVKGSELIFHGADYMKQYITPEAEAREVDPRLAQGLAAAAWVSKGACRVSGWLVGSLKQSGFDILCQVGRVGEATMALGRLAAPHLERSANRCLLLLFLQNLISCIDKQGSDSHDKSDFPRKLEPAEDRGRGRQRHRGRRLDHVHGTGELQQDPGQEYCQQYGDPPIFCLLIFSVKKTQIPYSQSLSYYYHW